ncbi:MAG: ATP-binding cassette domain-containing protein, partial [Gammaproteobacteria bacterium]|nr:ATP-binding cassette domain-containing protein [Gammaproteobacteria bacterium]
MSPSNISSSPLLELKALASPLFGPVSLTLHHGETLIISGPSGGGKSQLLRAMADLDPHQGQVFLHDQEMSSIPVCDWRRRVQLIPAESSWWGERVSDCFHSPSTARIDLFDFDADILLR